MSKIETLEPKKYYGYYSVYALLFIILILTYSFIFPPYARVNVFLILLFVVFQLTRLRKYPILTTSANDIYFNTNLGNLGSVSKFHFQINEIAKIWIEKKRFPLRRFFFLKPEIDAIFVISDDESPFFLLTLNSFKPKEREEIKVLIRNIQETVELKQKENL